MLIASYLIRVARRPDEAVAGDVERACAELVGEAEPGAVVRHPCGEAVGLALVADTDDRAVSELEVTSQKRDSAAQSFEVVASPAGGTRTGVRNLIR